MQLQRNKAMAINSTKSDCPHQRAIACVSAKLQKRDLQWLLACHSFGFRNDVCYVAANTQCSSMPTQGQQARQTANTVHTCL